MSKFKDKFEQKLDSVNHVFEKSLEYAKQNNFYKQATEEEFAIEELTNLLVWGNIYFLQNNVSVIVREMTLELDISYHLALQGYYRHSYVSLRSSLELGLTFIYFILNDSEINKIPYSDFYSAESYVKNFRELGDSSQTDEELINDYKKFKDENIGNKEKSKYYQWLSGKAKTPPFTRVLNNLEENSRIKAFSNKFNIIEKTKKLHSNLSSYSHHKGYKFTYAKLNNGDPYISTFNEDLLTTYFKYRKSVTRIVVMIASLYRPLILKEFDVEKKFASEFDKPLSINAYADKYRELFTADEISYFDKLTQDDDEMNGFIEWFNNLPDLSDEDRERIIKESIHNMHLDMTEEELKIMMKENP